MSWIELPIGITLASFFAAWYTTRNPTKSSNLGGALAGMLQDSFDTVIVYGLALVLTLTSWLIYFIIF